MMKVSCILVTYNRVTHSCVHEAVESFLRQDWPDRELIVSNECPAQQLTFDHPRVRVLNQPARAACHAEAVNRAAAAGDGDLIAIWDDDDIHLPWSLSLRVRLLEDRPGGVGVVGHFYSERNTIVKVTRGMHDSQGWLMRRELWEEFGGYRAPLNQRADIDLVIRLGDRLPKATVPDDQMYFIYRWGDGNYHFSGQGEQRDGDPNQYDAIGRLPVAPGEHRVTPHWRRDYVQDAREFVAKRLAAR